MRWGLRFVFILPAVLALPGVAGAAEWTVAKLSGHVVIRSGPVQETSLTSGMVLKSGSLLFADKTGRALLMHGGDQMIVSPNTLVALPKDSGAMTTILERFGEIEFDVAHKNAPHFTIDTPFLAAIVKGTHFKVRVLKQGASVAVQRGRVEVDDFITGEKVDVLPGQVALVTPGRHLSVTGAGSLSPILQGKPGAAPANPFSGGGAASNGITASLGGRSVGSVGASLGNGGMSANLGGVAGVSGGRNGVSASVGGGAASVGVGSSGISASVAGGSLASVSAGGGGVSVGVAGGAVGASLGGSGLSVNVGGLSIGGTGRHH
jgi:hypothetical protein